jgi:hypothetical protein
MGSVVSLQATPFYMALLVERNMVVSADTIFDRVNLVWSGGGVVSSGWKHYIRKTLWLWLFTWLYGDPDSDIDHCD